MSKPTSATPKPLSEAELTKMRADVRLHEHSGLYDDWARLLATINDLKAQPAPLPLAEDEALIAEAARNCRDNLWASRLAERLSLRSGQLAQVLALCDERDLASAESRKYGGAFCYAQVLTTDEIRNLLTTEEQER